MSSTESFCNSSSSDERENFSNYSTSPGSSIDQKKKKKTKSCFEIWEKKLQKWIVIGIDKKSAKKVRGKYTPSCKGKRISLQVPELDESLYLRLKGLKKSSASKLNIDPIEKAWRQFQYKIFDLDKPLLFLDHPIKGSRRSRSDSTRDKKAKKCALKLWLVLVREVNKICRLNVLHQTYPK